MRAFIYAAAFVAAAIGGDSLSKSSLDCLRSQGAQIGNSTLAPEMPQPAEPPVVVVFGG